MPGDVSHIPDAVQAAFPRWLPLAPQPGSLTVREFRDRHMACNMPALLGPELVRDWPVFARWRQADSGAIDLAAVREDCGSLVAPLVHCGASEQERRERKLACETTVASFIDEYMCCVPAGSSSSEQTSDDLSESDVVMRAASLEPKYLKDWHLFLQAGGDGCAQVPRLYRLPAIFAEDWLNEYCLARGRPLDDYRFLYLGTRGSFTPLHCDVLNSYSWSTNISGRKLWILFPPEQTPLLRLYPKGSSTLLLGNIFGPRSPEDAGEHGHAATAAAAAAARARQRLAAESTPTIFVQEAGQTVFVPSGWYHQVHNLQPTLSINHNWLNACNILESVRAMHADLVAAGDAIADLRDAMAADAWASEGQNLLQANTGFDCRDMVLMLARAASAAAVNACGAEEGEESGKEREEEEEEEGEKRRAGGAVVGGAMCVSTVCKQLASSFCEEHSDMAIRGGADAAGASSAAARRSSMSDSLANAPEQVCVGWGPQDSAAARAKRARDVLQAVADALVLLVELWASADGAEGRNESVTRGPEYCLACPSTSCQPARWRALASSIATHVYQALA